MAIINIVLVILIVRCAIVETSQNSAEQKMTTMFRYQRKLIGEVDYYRATVLLLQEDVKGLEADVKGLKAFTCYFDAICELCTYLYC